jgi:hypothetical protein
MNDFFNSKFITDLKNGELPEVKIVFPPETLFNISLSAFLVTVSILMVAGIFKKLAG